MFNIFAGWTFTHIVLNWPRPVLVVSGSWITSPLAHSCFYTGHVAQYVQNGSSVYVCFLDASKAFDLASRHDVLFELLRVIWHKMASIGGETHYSHYNVLTIGSSLGPEPVSNEYTDTIKTKATFHNPCGWTLVCTMQHNVGKHSGSTHYYIMWPHRVVAMTREDVLSCGSVVYAAPAKATMV